MYQNVVLFVSFLTLIVFTLNRLYEWLTFRTSCSSDSVDLISTTQVVMAIGRDPTWDRKAMESVGLKLDR